MKKKISTYKNKSKKILAIFLSYLIPVAVFAQGIIPCGPGGTSGSPCTLDDVPILISNIMDLLMTIVVPLAIVAFAIGGVYMMFAPAKESNYATGKNIIINTFLGMVFSFSSWLIVQFILYTLGYKEAFSWVATGI